MNSPHPARECYYIFQTLFSVSLNSPVVLFLICFAQWPHSSSPLPRVFKSSSFSTSLPALAISGLCYSLAILTGVSWYPLCIDLHFTDDRLCVSFPVPVSHLHVFFGKMSDRAFSPFLIVYYKFTPCQMSGSQTFSCSSNSLHGLLSPLCRSIWSLSAFGFCGMKLEGQIHEIMVYTEFLTSFSSGNFTVPNIILNL
jgi:hypothetical protein